MGQIVPPFIFKDLLWRDPCLQCCAVNFLLGLYVVCSKVDGFEKTLNHDDVYEILCLTV